MKKLLLLAFMPMALCAYGNHTEITISGINETSAKKIFLYQVIDGFQCPVDTIKADSGQCFTIKHPVEIEGFYTIGINETQQFPLYLKPGDSASVRLEDYKLFLTGENSPENKMVYVWEDAAWDVRNKVQFYLRERRKERTTYTTFFPMLESLASKKDSIQALVNTENKAFNELMRKKISYDLDYYAIYFNQVNRPQTPTKEEMPTYYSTIVSTDKFQDAEVLRLPYGREMLLAYMSYALLNSESSDYSNEKLFSHVGNDCLKGEYLLHYAEEFYASYDEVERMLGTYSSYFPLASQQKRIDALLKKLAYSKPGIDAPNFTCKDRDGKEVSLSDYKGKVVVMDVWATWCAPCRKQMPLLAEIEETFHNEKDIVFVSMCIGSEIEREEWLKLLGSIPLKAVHIYMPSWTGPFAKSYKVNGVPRYMIFDKEGKIVTINAPQPTSSALKEMIETVLEKNR